MDLGNLGDKAKEFASEHSEQIEQGVDKAADLAKEKFGHDEQIDKVVNKIEDAIPGGE
jgi:proline dehydrogenase